MGVCARERSAQASAGDPATRHARKADWLTADLQPRYVHEMERDDSAPAQVSPPPNVDGAVAGTASASRRTGLPTRGAVRTASIIMIMLGVASLATGGLLSLPSLVYGLAFRHRRGGPACNDDKDAALFLVGMVLAGLPLLFWILLLPMILDGAT